MGRRKDDIDKAPPSSVIGKRTICEVHREIYDVIYEEFPDRKDIIERLEEAYGLAKKMDARLRYYAHNYDDQWWTQQSKKEAEWRTQLRNKRFEKK